MNQTKIYSAEHASPTITRPPVSVGYWQLGGPTGLRIMMTKRPRWLHRFMMRHLLGWEWGDTDKRG